MMNKYPLTGRTMAVQDVVTPPSSTESTRRSSRLALNRHGSSQPIQ